MWLDNHTVSGTAFVACFPNELVDFSHGNFIYNDSKKYLHPNRNSAYLNLALIVIYIAKQIKVRNFSDF